MADIGNEKRTLRFRTRGDLLSALLAAEKWGILVERVEEDLEYLVAVPVNQVVKFQGLGSINFGIEVRG